MTANARLKDTKRRYNKDVLHTKLESVPPGLYKHYEGKLYNVLGTADHAEVVNRSVIYHPENEPSKLITRSLVSWKESVKVGNSYVRRFELVNSLN